MSRAKNACEMIRKRFVMETAKQLDQQGPGVEVMKISAPTKSKVGQVYVCKQQQQERSPSHRWWG